MSGQPNSKLKLLAIKNILERYSDDDHDLTADEIAAYLEKDYRIACERKSVYKDVDVLRKNNMDIIRTHGGYHIGSRLFEPAEIRLLSDAVQTANFISAKKTKQLLNKIYTLISVYQTETLKSHWFYDNISKSTNEKLFYHIDSLDKAIGKKKKVHLVYKRRKLTDRFSAGTDKKEFVLSPYALIWSNDHYYLIANYEKYDNLMNIRIDRIAQVDILDEPVRYFGEVCDYTEKFDAYDYAAKHLNMFGGEAETVEFQCDEAILETVLDRFGERTQIRKSNEGGFRFVTDIAVNEGLVSYLMQFGDKIRVVRPESLIQMVKERTAAILSAYENT